MKFQIYIFNASTFSIHVLEHWNTSFIRGGPLKMKRIPYWGFHLSSEEGLGPTDFVL